MRYERPAARDRPAAGIPELFQVLCSAFTLTKAPEEDKKDCSWHTLQRNLCMPVRATVNQMQEHHEAAG